MIAVSKLYTYQREIYDEIPRKLAVGPVLVQSPAGSGKSIIIAATCERIIAAGRIAFVLTHRDKIAKQLTEHCSATAINAKTDYCHIQLGKCYVAMNQTLIKRLHILEQLVTLGKQVVFIIDEAHRGDFNKTFDAVPDAYRVGFTATPAWKWAKHLSKYYTQFIHGLQISQLTQSGYLTPIDYYEMRNDLTGLEKGSNGEFTEASNEFTFDKAKVYDGLFTELPRFKFNKCIIFTASKKSADRLQQQFITHGVYKSVVYYSGLKNGDYELAKFTKLNQANVLITVAALSEGFDYPAIDFGILWRATSSLPLFIQMCNRIARIFAGKASSTLLDFGGNNTRFGGRKNINALTMDRDWLVLSQPPPVLPKLSNGVAAIKNCPACDFIISATARSCCNCGYIYPTAEVELKQGELVKIEHDLQAAREAANSLTGRRISTLTPKELATYAKERDKKAFGMRVAKALELRQKGYLDLYANAIGYKSSWATRQLQDLAELKMYHEQQFDTPFSFPFADIIVS